MKVEVRNLQEGHQISSLAGLATVTNVFNTSGEYTAIVLQFKSGKTKMFHWKPRTKIKVHNISV